MESILARCKISQPCPIQGLREEPRLYISIFRNVSWTVSFNLSFTNKFLINWQLSTHLELVKQFRHFGINFTRFIVFDLQFSANISQISLPAKLFPSLFKNKIAKVLFVGSFKWQCQCIFLWHCESWTGHLQKGFTGMPRHAYREPFTECLSSIYPQPADNVCSRLKLLATKSIFDPP